MPLNMKPASGLLAASPLSFFSFCDNAAFLSDDAAFHHSPQHFKPSNSIKFHQFSIDGKLMEFDGKLMENDGKKLSIIVHQFSIKFH